MDGISHIHQNLVGRGRNAGGKRDGCVLKNLAACADGRFKLADLCPGRTDRDRQRRLARLGRSVALLIISAISTPIPAQLGEARQSIA